jgi:outer membrane lipoprotein-sorting protein
MRREMKKMIIALVGLVGLIGSTAGSPSARDARAIIEAGFDHYRGKASEATVEMVIHRPSWERVMKLDAWTKGTDRSLVRITAPAKDEGNGTLKRGREMWTYNPKVNRVIKLPPSLMSQSWLGSDFSNNDVAKSDSILTDYTHELVGTTTQDGHTVWIIKSTPKPDAPVVWGMQILHIRDDDVLLMEEYFDEDLQPVKRMTGSQIQMLGGRMFPKVWKMQEQDKKGQYTLLRYDRLVFKDDLPESTFTLNRLKTQQRR